ncbi:MAG: rhamnan synthesis F family protein [Legionella sp.]|nr:rhamnan synthesis F family protein [Legionella sp.]
MDQQNKTQHIKKTRTVCREITKKIILKSIPLAAYLGLSKIIVKLRFSECDAHFYLKTYPDITSKKINPYKHFLLHGKSEGKKIQPFFSIAEGATPFSNQKETVILTSHDATRSGAPILSINIAKALNQQFNLIIILLNGGCLYNSFKSNCFEIIQFHPKEQLTPYDFDCLIKQVIQKYKIKFSILNSIESQPILSSIAKHFIPSTLLIHEFPTYIRPKNKLTNALFSAGITIFPTKMLQDAHSNINIKEAIQRTHILPQGKSQIPIQQMSHNKRSDQIFSHVSKKNSDSKPFIILGAGKVEYRKGVDLFIATAVEIKRLNPDYNIQMVWVGDGFDPENDLDYSCYLQQQIEAFELKKCLSIFDACDDLENLYQKINLFYLSSRLDPMPNVAIDTMIRGIPLICFNKGSGAVEFLEQDQDTATCIIPHMSVVDSARKIIELYESPHYYALISNKLKTLAQNTFNMDAYVSKLIQLSTQQIAITKQESLDYHTLEKSPDFLDQFCMPGIDRSEVIRTYIRSWYSKIKPTRKPTPGFNQDIYALHHHCEARNVEPFTDYIRNGKPKGAWQDEVIQPQPSIQNKNTQPSCAIHIHAFYPDLLSEILNRLQCNASKYDFYISTTDENETIISNLLKKEIKNNQYLLKVVPNRGRDIGPFLTAFNQELQAYDVIGHIHTKRSLDLNNHDVSKAWMNFLLENLLGKKYPILDQILDRFEKQPKLGLIFPDDPHLIGWDKNQLFAEQLATQLNLSNLPKGRFNFPVGTMFWARPEALKPLFELNWTWDDYPEEPLLYDGSTLHAIERLIPTVVANQGFKHAVTYIPGISR